MEDSLNIPIFLEFYGLPGCGKSTVSHAVARLLRENGYEVAEPSYKIDHQKTLIRWSHKLLILCWDFLFHHNNYNEIRELVRKNGYAGIEVVLQTINVIQKILGYNRKGTPHLNIWDQGLIQAAISLSVNGNLSAGENYRNLLPFIKRNVRIVPVYMPVNIDVALRRMDERPTNDSRVEKVSDLSQKREMMERIQDGISSIKRILEPDSIQFIIEENQCIEEEARSLFQKIEGFVL